MLASLELLRKEILNIIGSFFSKGQPRFFNGYLGPNNAGNDPLLLLTYVVLIFFLLGCVFMLGASFCGYFQCMIYRKRNNIKLLIARSFCDVCGKTITGLDPVPVLNRLFLKGRCRHCNARIPSHYFYSELLSGFIALVFFISPLPILAVFFLSIIVIFLFSFNTLLWPNL